MTKRQVGRPRHVSGARPKADQAAARRLETVSGFTVVDVIESTGYADNWQRDELLKGLRSLVLQQLPEHGTEDRWDYDGGRYRFTLSDGYDEMVLFADRVRRLLPLFSHRRRAQDHADLPEVRLRIVCHAGIRRR